MTEKQKKLRRIKRQIEQYGDVAVTVLIEQHENDWRMENKLDKVMQTIAEAINE